MRPGVVTVGERRARRCRVIGESETLRGDLELLECVLGHNSRDLRRHATDQVGVVDREQPAGSADRAEDRLGVKRTDASKIDLNRPGYCAGCVKPGAVHPNSGRDTPNLASRDTRRRAPTQRDGTTR